MMYMKVPGIVVASPIGHSAKTSSTRVSSGEQQFTAQPIADTTQQCCHSEELRMPAGERPGPAPFRITLPAPIKRPIASAVANQKPGLSVVSMRGYWRLWRARSL